jgi:hypothetical protein
MVGNVHAKLQSASLAQDAHAPCMVSGGQRKDDIKKSKKSNAKHFFNTHLLLTAKFNSAFLASWFGDGPAARRPALILHIYLLTTPYIHNCARSQPRQVPFTPAKPNNLANKNEAKDEHDGSTGGGLRRRGDRVLLEQQFWRGRHGVLSLLGHPISATKHRPSPDACHLAQYFSVSIG